MRTAKIAIEINCDGNYCSDCQFNKETFFLDNWCDFFDCRIDPEGSRCRECIDSQVEEG
jgi:hypothetical protein